MKRGKVIALVLAVVTLGACASTGGSRAESAEAGDVLAMLLSGQSATQGGALEAAIKKASAHPLGSEKNPVRAEMPSGQRAYLQRLRCADGKAPRFSRIGSMGMEPYGNIVDGYDVRCEGSEPATSVIYMDMYHRGHVENEAVPGFTITG